MRPHGQIPMVRVDREVLNRPAAKRPQPFPLRPIAELLGLAKRGMSGDQINSLSASW